VVLPGEIAIDEAIMPAEWSVRERAEWAVWARTVLAHGVDTGEWPDGEPVVSDRGPERLDGMRYVLLGFEPAPGKEG
jgi:hypothetical protein